MQSFICRKPLSVLIIYCLVFATPLVCSTLGGQLNYRIGLITEGYYRHLNDTPLNQDNKWLPQNRYGNFTSADLFLKYGPFTMAIKSLADYTDRDPSAYRAVIRELYFDRGIGDAFQITVGRKILKWGTGYAFNPCGVMEPARQASDPSDRREQYLGKQILAIDAYSEAQSLSLVYANEARYKDKFHRGKHELASRFYTLIHDIDLSLIGFWKEDDKFKWGITTAYTYGSHIELHSEWICQLGTNKLYHRALSDPNFQPNLDISNYIARYQNSEKLFPKLLLGAQYTFDNGINLMIEYYYNREGLTHREWQRWRKFILSQIDGMNASPPNPLSFVNFYSALSTLDKYGTMRHYAFCRGYWPQQRSSAEFLLFENLVDGSGAGIVTLNYIFRSGFTAWIRGECYVGKRNSEFGLLFLRSAILVGAKYGF